MKSILFITTSSLATNPRLVKEFETLKKQYNCYVLCFKHQDWSLTLSEAIKVRNPEVIFWEVDRKLAFSETIVCKVIHKCAILLNNVFKRNFNICAFANNDKALQLFLRTRSLNRKTEFSRIVAHNLGAFYAAVKLSEKRIVPLQLDIEDYYPGEAFYFNENREKENRMYIMAYSFSRAECITYASKGIQLECEKHFKVGRQTKQLTIINVFKAIDFVKPKNTSFENLKCVWFSQNIGPNRGLEQVFDAAKRVSHIEFHIIGNRIQAYLNSVDLSDNVRLHDIMKQEQLHDFLSGMDIGLALEDIEADFNRNICLTNKFLAYAQSGLYILATDTFGQSQFLNSLDYQAGVIIEDSLTDTLFKLDKNLFSTSSKIERWQKAKSFSWENEQLKLRRILS